MTAHSRALVPAEAWCYASPDVRAASGNVDIGLIAEALLYYEHILLNIGNGEQLAELLAWLVAQGTLQEFLALVEDGTIRMFDFAFLTSAIQGPDGYSLWNIQDPISSAPNSFAQRFLYTRSLREAVPRSRDRRRLYSSLADNAIEVKSEECGAAIANARADVADPRRNSIIMQAFIDDLWQLRGLGRPPEIRASVVERLAQAGHNITWNVDFKEIERIAGKELGFHPGVPLVAGALCNRQLWGAAREGCDLFLSSPMSALTGDKLYETVKSPVRLSEIVDQLTAAVEFPDVRRLVNSGYLTLHDILTLRKKSKRFREWLQSEADRDRDAILAYHNEIGKESGLLRGARKSLALFAVASGGALGSAMGAALAGPAGGAVGGAAGASATYLLDLAAKIGANWRPVVFGDWMRSRIETLVASRE